MDEQFDKKLTNHIKGVFDNYEHAGVEHGWAQLKNKFPAEEKSNKIAWLWWSSAAAVVLVFLSIGIWYNNQGTVVNNMANKPVKQQQQQPVIKDTASINTNPSINKQEPVIAKNNAVPAFNNTIATPAYRTPIGTKPSAPNAASTQIAQGTGVAIGHPQPTFNTVQPTVIAQTNPVTTNSTAPLIDSQKLINNTANQPQLASTTQPATNAMAQPPVNNAINSFAKQQPTKTMADMFENDRLNQTGKATKQAKQNNKNVNISVYAATYFNYAEGSTNQINAGAGFTSDFRLSKNLKLSTGVALAQNSLSYNTAAPQAASTMFSSASTLKQENAFGTVALVPIFKNYNATLVGLDIPINIKYEFNPQKSDAYISAGLSSGTFIDENYTYRYTYSNGTKSASESPNEQTAHNSFNSFYFGKTLNLSFGLGYPLGSNRLIVEPFVKYPLGGLGAQDIRFGAGGVNLKFSFKTQKK
jgi:hypothetical protein